MNYSCDIETTTLLGQNIRNTDIKVRPYIIGLVPKPYKFIKQNADKAGVNDQRYLVNWLTKKFTYFAGYDCGSEFVDWVEDNFDNIGEISFHNTTFDWSYLENFFLDKGWKYDGGRLFGVRNEKLITTVQDENGIYLIRLIQDKKVVAIRCSLKLLNKSVKDVGAQLGIISKGEIDYNAYNVYNGQKDYYSKLKLMKDFHGDNDFLLFKNKDDLVKSELGKKLIGYLKRDCIIPVLGEEQMRQGYHNLTKKHLKKAPITLSSYSQKIVEDTITTYSKGKNAMGTLRLKQTFKNPLTLNQFREIKTGYLGGFTGYQRGSLNKLIHTPNGRSYDANSFFPSIMNHNPLPGGTPQLKLLKRDDIKDFLVLHIIKVKSFKMKPEIKASGAPAFIQRGGNLIGFTEKDKSNDNPHYLIEATNPNKSEQDGVISYWADHLKQLRAYYDIDYSIIKTYYFKKQWKYKAFINKIYPLKSNAKDAATRNTAKLLLNTIYGKTGQEPVRQTTHYIDEAELLNIYRLGQESRDKLAFVYGSKLVTNIENKLIGDDYKFNYHKRGTIKLKTTMKYENSLLENKDSNIVDYKVSNVAIAHRITSIARHKLMGIIMRDPKNVLYWDTDSVYMFNDRPEQLGFCIHDTKINCWKAEKSFDKFKVLRGKAYALSYKGEFDLTISGYNPNKITNNTHIKSFDDFKFGRTWIQTQGVRTENGIIITERKLQLKENKFNFKSFD